MAAIFQNGGQNVIYFSIYRLLVCLNPDLVNMLEHGMVFTPL